VISPDVVHFYSYVTGVSIELPAGFEFAGETEESAVYADLDDAPPGERTPQFRIQVVGTLNDPADAYDAVVGLADGFAAMDGTVLTRVDRVVDEEPTATVVLRRAGDGLLLHLTAAAGGRRLLSMVATALDESLLPAYDAAIESIRFIEL
jgi:hypothetical protein